MASYDDLAILLSQDGSELRNSTLSDLRLPLPSGTVTTTDHTVSTVTGSTTGEAPFGSDVSFGVGGKTLTLDLSAHYDGSTNDYYGAAEAIAAAINGDSDLQAFGYSAAAATLAEVTAGTYAAGDIIITRADTPTTTTNTLVGNAASFVVEGITVNTDLSAYSADLSGAAAAVASDINADAGPAGTGLQRHGGHQQSLETSSSPEPIRQLHKPMLLPPLQLLPCRLHQGATRGLQRPRLTLPSQR